MASLEERKAQLQREIDNNKVTNSQIESKQRQLTKLREEIQQLDKDKENLEGEVAIQRNQLSAFATEL